LFVYATISYKYLPSQKSSGSMTSNSLISVRLPEDIIEFIDYLVRSGIGKCRSDILRLAVLYKLKSMGYKVSTEELDDVISRLKSFRGSGR